MYAYAAASAGDIEEARVVVAAQFKDAHTFSLRFVLPYGLLIEALIALVGASSSAFTDLIDRAESAGRAAGDDLLTTIATSDADPSLVAQGRFKEAISVSMRNLGEITRSAHGEVIASRAIALACNREDERALSTAELAGQTTSAIEATVCSAAARAIVAGNRAESNVFELAKVALESATAHHCVECFMAAYRGSPELARVLLAADETRERCCAFCRLLTTLTALTPRHRAWPAPGSAFPSASMTS